MAAETFAANKLMESVIIGGRKDLAPLYTEIREINGTDITGGLLVTTEGESTPDKTVDLLAAGEVPLGVALGYAVEADKKASYSLGVTIADNKYAKILRKTGGQILVQMLLNRADSVSAAIAIGDPLYASQTDAGKLTTLVAFATDGADLALVDRYFVGRSADTVAVSVTADKIIRVWV